MRPALPTGPKPSRATLHIHGLGGTITWIAQKLMDPPVSIPYTSRTMSGREAFSDRMFEACVRGFGADEAIKIRELAAEARAEYLQSDEFEEWRTRNRKYQAASS